MKHGDVENLKWIFKFTLPQIQHGANFIFFSYLMFICLASKHLNSETTFGFGSIILFLEPSKGKPGSHNHFLCLHKNIEFQIDKQQREGRAFCLVMYFNLLLIFY